EASSAMGRRLRRLAADPPSLSWPHDVARGASGDQTRTRHAGDRTVQAEAADLLVQAYSLVGQLAGGGGGLFGHGGVLLGDVVHLAHGAADAGQAFRLFLSRAGDAARQPVDGCDLGA